MSRIARAVAPGLPHHITQRGNNRQKVFFADDDRRVYLDLLAEQSERFGLRLLAYCLLTNHVHLIVVPREPASLAKTVGRTHYLYTKYLHRLHRRCGHLWQNRFYSCILDERHFAAAACYVERNPVRAKLVRRAWDHRWSSAAVHAGHTRDWAGLDRKGWRQLCLVRDWRTALQQPQDDDIVQRLRSCTYTGRPLASDSMISKIEALLGRRLRANPVGRPRKKAERKRKR